MKPHTFLIAGLLSLLIGCATVPTGDIEVTTETDPKVNLQGYKTYAWVGTAQLLNDPMGQWEPGKVDLDSELRFLIDRELRGKKLTQTTNQPDLLVGFVAGVDMSVLGIKKDPESRMMVLKNTPKGALVVLLIDSNTLYPVWVGSAVANVNQERSTEEMQKRLDYAVRSMFSEFAKE